MTSHLHLHTDKDGDDPTFWDVFTVPEGNWKEADAYLFDLKARHIRLLMDADDKPLPHPLLFLPTGQLLKHRIGLTKENMGRLILVRHGRSEWNVDDRMQGWFDSPLHWPLGYEDVVFQAHQLASVDPPLRRPLILSSPLNRARITAEICRAAIARAAGVDPGGLSVSADWRLLERHYGALTGIKRTEALHVFGPQRLKKWRRNARLRPPLGGPPYVAWGGESLCDVQRRLWPLFASLLPALFPSVDPVTGESLPGRDVVIVAHGNSIRAALPWLLVAVGTPEVEDAVGGSEGGIDTAAPLQGCVVGRGAGGEMGAKIQSNLNKIEAILERLRHAARESSFAVPRPLLAREASRSTLGCPHLPPLSPTAEKAIWGTEAGSLPLGLHGLHRESLNVPAAGGHLPLPLLPEKESVGEGVEDLISRDEGKDKEGPPVIPLKAERTVSSVGSGGCRGSSSGPSGGPFPLRLRKMKSFSVQSHADVLERAVVEAGRALDLMDEVPMPKQDEPPFVVDLLTGEFSQTDWIAALRDSSDKHPAETEKETGADEGKDSHLFACYQLNRSSSCDPPPSQSHLHPPSVGCEIAPSMFAPRESTTDTGTAAPAAGSAASAGPSSSSSSSSCSHRDSAPSSTTGASASAGGVQQSSSSFSSSLSSKGKSAGVSPDSVSAELGVQEPGEGEAEEDKVSEEPFDCWRFETISFDAMKESWLTAPPIREEEGFSLRSAPTEAASKTVERAHPNLQAWHVNRFVSSCIRSSGEGVGGAVSGRDTECRGVSFNEGGLAESEAALSPFVLAERALLCRKILKRRLLDPAFIESAGRRDRIETMSDR
uniref:phosphoglycerate mutase (2,3-diphosphoglycerate-dependent) n=1 Tax=Chromera velia CCMP2878 TaxID=1169474 RepID=A0A0G4HYU4_9ALVE|eukprot:Cvel_9585.t1-p1 / transcript=Cvel_9585.t1 / gene=Cvel_9585 / organism=Chromera_velia_CCMP2878 / gene_product=2,3-bisphosphoglycerate-dependent phosphoglycerate, putative / transcript_product=2,3-bisphosphoglycerate-dependent phosphoglycerate, putative / location=Cvel_scaffold556:11918-16847(+) / protein_length=827 / sequence_SO=supercontig / SO=protein_coding / is_pseudo=false